MADVQDLPGRRELDMTKKATEPLFCPHCGSGDLVNQIAHMRGDDGERLSMYVDDYNDLVRAALRTIDFNTSR